MASQEPRKTAFLTTIQGALVELATAATVPPSADPAALADTVAPPIVPTPGATLAPSPTEVRFEVLKVLGEGGMGTVYTARDRQFGRIVALKELHPQLQGTSALFRFRQEAAITANLEHPGIAPVYAWGVRGGAPYYAMRRVEGRTLTEAMGAAQTTIERLALLATLIQVAHTLAYAHERGVVHRDVKPDNILLGAHGETVLLDWGIARFEGSDPDADAQLAHAIGTASQTVAGQVMGTPAYMAPEQATGNLAAIDARTDVFALGALLYELLAGHAPYRADTLAQLVLDAAAGQREPLSRAAPDAPPLLVAIAERAMATRPEERYASAADLVKALEGFQAAALLGRDPPAARWFAVAATIGALGVVVLGCVFLMGVSSTIREQGRGGLFLLFLVAIGLSLTALEWRTDGRLRLRGVTQAIAFATVMMGLANSTAALSIVLTALEKPMFFENMDRFRAIFISGLRESLGSSTAGLLLGSFQWLASALVARTIDRARDARRAP